MGGSTIEGGYSSIEDVSLSEHTGCSGSLFILFAITDRARCIVKAYRVHNL